MTTNTAWMQSPDGAETREVPENELTPLMIQGWRQVAAPISETTAKEEE